MRTNIFLPFVIIFSLSPAIARGNIKTTAPTRPKLARRNSEPSRTIASTPAQTTSKPLTRSQSAANMLTGTAPASSSSHSILSNLSSGLTVGSASGPANSAKTSAQIEAEQVARRKEASPFY